MFVVPKRYKINEGILFLIKIHNETPKDLKNIILHMMPFYGGIIQMSYYESHMGLYWYPHLSFRFDDF